MTFSSHLLLLLSIATVIALVVHATDDYDIAIRQVMNANGIVGSAVVFYDGSDPDHIVNFTRGYGKVSGSDLSAENVTADTAFMLASVSKVFTGSAVATLLDQGILSSLDEDICDSLPDMWKTDNNLTACRNPYFPDTPITWRMLVTHRSGLMRDVPPIPVNDGTGDVVLASYGPANFTHYFGPTYGNPTCPLDNLQDFYHAILTPDNVTTLVGGGDIDWYNVTLSATDGVGGAWGNATPPGSNWAYSNFDVGYVATLIEFKTNQSFASYCNDNLFDKLDMPNTAWFREDLPSTTLQARPQGLTGQDVGFFCFIDYPSGQLYSTANDLAKFLSSMMTYGVKDNLWSENVGSLLFSCQEQDASRNAVTANECQNGVFWFVLDNSKKEGNNTDLEILRPLVDYDWTGGAMHEGDQYGVSTVIVILPAANVYLAILNNIVFLDKSPPALILDAIATTRATTTTPSSLEPVAPSPSATSTVTTGTASAPTVASATAGSGSGSTDESSASWLWAGPGPSATSWSLTSVVTFLVTCV